AEHPMKRVIAVSAFRTGKRGRTTSDSDSDLQESVRHAPAVKKVRFAGPDTDFKLQLEVVKKFVTSALDELSCVGLAYKMKLYLVTLFYTADEANISQGRPHLFSDL